MFFPDPAVLQAGSRPTSAAPRDPRAWFDLDQLSGDPVESSVVTAWRNQVAMLKPFYKLASGKIGQGQAVVVQMPSGDYKGQLGFKYPSAAQPGNTVTAWTYTAAPANVRAADIAYRAQLDAARNNWATDLDTGVAQSGQIIQRLAKSTAETAGAIVGGAAGGVGKGIGDALGIPAWAVPVGLGAAALLAVKVLAPGLLPFGRGR